MKKQLLFGTALLAAISAFPQSNNRVVQNPRANMYDTKADMKLRYAGFDDAHISASPLLGSSQAPTQSSSNRASSSPPTAITWKLLSGSSNVYGQLVSTSRPLQYNPNVNAVS